MRRRSATEGHADPYIGDEMADSSLFESPPADDVPAPKRPRPGTRLQDTRPLTARSVIGSVLLGSHPPRLSVRRLVRTCELFAISDGTARVAISRMVRSGELAPIDGGYVLAGELLGRQARQQEGRAPSAPAPWNGDWIACLVHPDGRTPNERADLRRAMRRLHLGEFREGTWMRPDNLDPARDAWATTIVDRQCANLRSAVPDDSQALVDRVFALTPWAEEARRLEGALRHWQPRLEAGDQAALAPGFECNAAVLRHLLADPQLPSELLPHDWPGPRLRAVFNGFDRAYATLWRAWLRTDRE